MNSFSAGTIPVTSGATILTAYAEREVKAYPVLESEIQVFRVFNTIATGAIGGASAFFFAAVGIWSNAAFVETPTPAGLVLTHFAAPALCAVAICLVGLALWASWSRGSTWAAIKMGSKSGVR